MKHEKKIPFLERFFGHKHTRDGLTTAWIHFPMVTWRNNALCLPLDVYFTIMVLACVLPEGHALRAVSLIITGAFFIDVLTAALFKSVLKDYSDSPTPAKSWYWPDGEMSFSYRFGKEVKELALTLYVGGEESNFGLTLAIPKMFYFQFTTDIFDNWIADLLTLKIWFDRSKRYNKNRWYTIGAQYETGFYFTKECGRLMLFHNDYDYSYNKWYSLSYFFEWADVIHGKLEVEVIEVTDGIGRPLQPIETDFVLNRFHDYPEVEGRLRISYERIIHSRPFLFETEYYDRTNIEIIATDIPIYCAGKGENSWDCGARDLSTYEIGVPGIKTAEEAKRLIIEEIFDLRRKYG